MFDKKLWNVIKEYLWWVNVRGSKSELLERKCICLQDCINAFSKKKLLICELLRHICYYAVRNYFEKLFSNSVNFCNKLCSKILVKCFYFSPFMMVFCSSLFPQYKIVLFKKIFYLFIHERHTKRMRQRHR